MSRCYECSKVIIPKRHRDFKGRSMRTWSSGPELIRLSENGCDLCSFVRKHAEKTSTANLRRASKKATIVLRDCHSEITLGFYPNAERLCMIIVIISHRLRALFNMEPIADDAQISVLTTPYDPVRHARELSEACMLGDKIGHHNCGRVKMGVEAGVDQLPRRLIDLSQNDYVVTLDVPTWINTSRATVDQLSDYCTLSYRWGQGPPGCSLSTQPIGDLILPLESLPQTFKDAVIVARALQIRFIWIDAMCIIQPSAHGDFTDWNVEGSRMWLVYQNAICNIAATCSRSPNDGFLSRVGTEYNAPCRIPAEIEKGATQPMFLPEATAEDLYFLSVTCSNLNMRGWVAQERLLSRRILHFTEEKVFWECQAVGVSSKSPTSNQLGDQIFQHAALLTFRKWLLFIQLYSMSNFTQLTDRLIALSSIARSVPAELFGTTYFAGIWGEHLVECLSWRSCNPCSTDLRRRYLDLAPSWSWASVPEQIENNHVIHDETRKTLIRLEHEFPSLFQASNLAGRMGPGATKFLARVCSMSLPTCHTQDVMIEDFDTEHGSSVIGTIFWDEIQDPGAKESVYHVVPLWIPYGSDYRTQYFVSLVVAPVPSKNDYVIYGPCEVYQRIGSLHLRLYSKYHTEERMYKEFDYTILFNAVFPSATEQSIVIV